MKPVFTKPFIRDYQGLSLQIQKRFDKQLAFLREAPRHPCWVLAPPLLLGAILSVPLAALTVKKLPERSFTLVIGILVLVLGTLSLLRIL